MNLDVESVLAGLRNARRETIMAWCPTIAEGGPDHCAEHLLNALLDLELAIKSLEDEDNIRRLTVENADLRAQLAAATANDDDEPSVGDVTEAERSDIRGMVAASQGRPSS